MLSVKFYDTIWEGNWFIYKHFTNFIKELLLYLLLHFLVNWKIIFPFFWRHMQIQNSWKYMHLKKHLGEKVDMLPEVCETLWSETKYLFHCNWFLYFKKFYAFATIIIIIFVSSLINMSSILFLSMLYHVFNLFHFFDLNHVCEVVREVRLFWLNLRTTKPPRSMERIG